MTSWKQYPAISKAGSIYLNCDEPDIRQSLTNAPSTEIKALFGKASIVFLDEAQRVNNRGLSLKLAVDNFPEIPEKLRKIYFVDTGIRNALINNFNPMSLRQDAGALWENFMISERLKMNGNQNRAVAMYFWRTHQQQEIDLIEDSGGRLAGFEFKWGKKKFRAPKLFQKTYPDSTVVPVMPSNFSGFI